VVVVIVVVAVAVVVVAFVEAVAVAITVAVAAFPTRRRLEEALDDEERDDSGKHAETKREVVGVTLHIVAMMMANVAMTVRAMAVAVIVVIVAPSSSCSGVRHDVKKDIAEKTADGEGEHDTQG